MAFFPTHDIINDVWTGAVPATTGKIRVDAVISGTTTITGTVDQGAPGTAAGAWFIKITDGTDVALVTAAGALVVDGSGSTQPVSGTVAATQSGAWTTGRTWVLASGTDSIAAVQSGTWVLGANSGVDIGDVTINNAAGAAAVNIQDGGNSITVDGTVTVTSGSIVSTKTALTPSSPTAASVGTSSGVVIAANATRKGLVLINTSTATMSFNIVAGAAVLNSGITLYPGGVWEMGEYTFTTNAINGIASAAASNVSIQELTT